MPTMELVNAAKDVIVREKIASVSLIQRRLKIQYSSALQVMERLQRLGIVTVPDSEGRRSVIFLP